MTLMALALAATLAATDGGVVVTGDLQAMYDEISATTLSATTPDDFDDFHAVFFTPDWSLTDRAGTRHTWADLRAGAIDRSTHEQYDAMRDVIVRASLSQGVAVTEVHSIVVRVVVDQDGKYGAPGATHHVAELTPMRDHWQQTDTGWKLQSREQIGDPKLFVDKLPPDLADPKGPPTRTK